MENSFVLSVRDVKGYCYDDQLVLGVSFWKENIHLWTMGKATVLSCLHLWKT